MKIYVRIKDDSQYIEFDTFCLINKVGQEYYDRPKHGVFCIDNTEEVAYYPSEHEVESTPKSFIINWDPKHIGDLYTNKVIGRFNEGKLKWTLMDSTAMAPMIEVLMYGMKKYDRDNWKKACPKRLDLMDSLERHSLKIIAGESIDPESGLPHIGHLMCNAMFYSYWEQKTNGLFENFEN
jgi:hypothetical protein